MPSFAEDAKKLRERVSALETEAHAKILKEGNSPTTRSKRIKTYIEAEVVHICVEFSA